MEFEWLSEKPDVVVSSSFYSEDDRFVIYRESCDESYEECFFLEDLGNYYYSIKFVYERVGDASTDLFWDLDWLETVRMPSGASVNEVADYLDVNQPVYESELIKYLLMLPEDVFGGHSEKEIVDSIDLIDDENYYLHLSPIWLDGDASFTVFIYQDSYYFAYETKGCGPLCTQNVYFFELAAYGVNDVTDIYLSELDFESMEADFDPLVPLYCLLQYSTTIEVYDQVTAEVLYELHWKDGKFEVENVYCD